MITTLAPIVGKENEFLLTLYNETNISAGIDINGDYGFNLPEYDSWTSLEKSKYDSDVSGNYFEFKFILSKDADYAPTSTRFINTRIERIHSIMLRPGDTIACVINISKLYVIGSSLPNEAEIRYRRIFPQIDGPAIVVESNWVNINVSKMQRLVLPEVPSRIRPVLPPVPPSLVNRALAPRVKEDLAIDETLTKLDGEESKDKTSPISDVKIETFDPNATSVKDLVGLTASGSALTNLLNPDWTGDQEEKPTLEPAIKTEAILAEPVAEKQSKLGIAKPPIIIPPVIPEKPRPVKKTESKQPVTNTAESQISPQHVYASEQKRLQERIGVWMYHTMHDVSDNRNYDPKRIELFFGSVGNKMRAGVRLITPQGRLEENGEKFDIIGVPDQTIMNNIRSLKDLMYRKNKGTWYETHLTVTSDGEFSATFNYSNIPQWGDYFEPNDYAADQKKYPRTDSFQPDWLKDKLTKVIELPVETSMAPALTS